MCKSINFNKILEVQKEKLDHALDKKEHIQEMRKIRRSAEILLLRQPDTLILLNA